MRKLTKLRRLQLAHNRIQKLPGELAGLTRLEELLLDNNKLSSLPPGVLSAMTSLQVLGLEDNELSSLPVKDFSSLSRLRILRVGGNTYSLSTSEALALLNGITRSSGCLRELSLRNTDLTTPFSLPPPSPHSPTSPSSTAAPLRQEGENLFTFLRHLKVLKVGTRRSGSFSRMNSDPRCGTVPYRCWT